jgi:hypothetical protein
VKPLSQQNLYEVLDVPFDASTAVIAEAVDRAQALYAPGSLATYTLMDPEEEHLLVRLLEEARATLLDPAARARYDEQITGPDSAPPPAQAPSPALDAAIRAAWPELPPVFPSAPQPADADEDEEEDDEWEDVPVGASASAAAAPEPVRPPAPVIPAMRVEAPVAPPPAQPPAAPPAAASAAAAPTGPRAPILLSREVASPLATERPTSTPVPITTPAPAAVAPVPPVEGTTWSGEVLRQIREARGISPQQISERTKVTRHHIENIEADRFELLPAAVYLRGILLSIARELRLDGQKVARSYLERVALASSPTAPLPRPK